MKRAGALGEIYAYGMRDPHRFSWDTGGTHRMFLGHIGEKDVEGVWDILPGDNLGWSEREGSFVFDRADPCDLFALPANDASFGYVYPVAEFDHNPPPNFPCQADVGHAISGGVVYRGHAAPALVGKYVFGDLVDGRIFYTNEREMQRGKPRATIHEMKILDDTGRLMTMQELVADTRVDLRFSSDDDDNLYLIAKSNGKIWKVTGARPLGDVFPTLEPNLVAHYDFEQPVTGKLFRERDRGLSGTTIDLINGGADMRVKDGAHLKSTTSIQLQQIDPTTQSENDWKAGIYSPTGVSTLHAFNAAHGITLMGWFKMTGTNPSLNTETPDPADFYNAIGLTGILTGDSEGHAVRALLEIINVNGELHLVALGRRIDGSASQTFAASDPWPTLLPQNEKGVPRRDVRLQHRRDGAVPQRRAARRVLRGGGRSVGRRRRRPPRDLGDRPARDQDRRQLPAEHPGAKPVQLPDGQPDVPRPRRAADRDQGAVPPGHGNLALVRARPC